MWMYPSPNQLLATRDSNFIFGSVGSGQATLTINGTEVPVYPNGAFMGWLPVPSGDRPRYELSVSSGSEHVTATVPVRLPGPPVPLADTGKLVIDAASAAPTGRLALRANEIVRVSLRAPVNATVTLRLAGGASRPMSRVRRQATFIAQVPRGRARPRARRRRSSPVAGADSAFELAIAAVTTLTDQSPARFVSLVNSDEDARSDTDQVTILRPVPGGTYKWFFFPGTVLELTGQRRVLVPA